MIMYENIKDWFRPKSHIKVYMVGDWFKKQDVIHNGDNVGYIIVSTPTTPSKFTSFLERYTIYKRQKYFVLKRSKYG